MEAKRILSDPRHYFLVALILVAVVVAIMLPPIHQDPAYHVFADRRGLLGIPNFLNIVTNLAFLAVGIAGLRQCAGLGQGLAARRAWTVCFAGASLVAFGSAYYHLAPENNTLVWDRLPMSIGFMGLFVAVLAEQINPRLEKWLLLPAVTLGIASVLYWHVVDDLRPYVLVQFLPLLMIPAVLYFYNRLPGDRRYLLAALAIYLLAKLAEHFDHGFYRLTGEMISGHSLKHLLAAIALLPVYQMLRRRDIP